ncbi:MAG: hypothetical protein DRQ97_08825 [Gammaproteobacteria bacterium]|nr:MAG: hypothetical protein DRQ97_08825 [Gammaproteobacteria bacterium]
MYDAPMASMKGNSYQLHRVALAPLLPNTGEADIAKACKAVASFGEQPFLDFLLQQGLGPMWSKVLEGSDDAHPLTKAFKDTLHQARMDTTGTYLIHRHKLTQIKAILAEANISHVVYKGADTRERLYTEPALRPAVDIDILVPEQQKVAAIKAFKQRGFDLYTSADIISHEANLVMGKTSIDLHWDILRPGRTRLSMVNALLESRVDYGSHWGMSDEATLFIMLVHPVFAKYGTTPHASLMRMVDLAMLLSKSDLNWQAVLRLLNRAGLKTAAWITLQWYELLTHLEPPSQLVAAIKPGALRQKYLNYWLEKNLSSKLLEKPIYVQLGFTLPAHDRFSDAIRAVRRARELRHHQEADLQALLLQT